MPDEHKLTLLERAIPYLTNPPYSLDFPKRLFVVDDDGTIYAGQTSEAGKSYHGYPYAGPMGPRLLRGLREQAQRLNCEAQFNKWVKAHIRPDRKPDL